MVGFPSLQKLQTKLANFIEVREVIYPWFQDKFGSNSPGRKEANKQYT